MPSIRIQIPPHSEPGDTLTFRMDGGKELELPVPQGALAGDVLEIQLMEHEDIHEADDDEDEDFTRLVLDSATGLELKLYSKLPTETHTASCSTDDATNNIANDCDGTHAMAWPAGRELAAEIRQMLQKADELIPPDSCVLELGAGLGLVGLANAAASTAFIHAQHSISQRIVLTDQPAAMPLLKYNLQQNAAVLSKDAGVTVEAKSIEWTANRSETGSNEQEQYYDLILGADLLYNINMIPALVATIQRHLRPETGMVILSIRWRKPDLERDFFVQTQQQLDLSWRLYQPDERDTRYCSLHWKEYGNPDSPVFRRYFDSTLIGVCGQPKPLAEISETDMASMTADEHQAWERAQIQIYVGTFAEERKVKRWKQEAYE